MTNRDCEYPSSNTKPKSQTPEKNPMGLRNYDDIIKEERLKNKLAEEKRLASRGLGERLIDLYGSIKNEQNLKKSNAQKENDLNLIPLAFGTKKDTLSSLQKYQEKELPEEKTIPKPDISLLSQLKSLKDAIFSSKQEKVPDKDC